jgi:hypothetical protein
LIDLDAAIDQAVLQSLLAWWLVVRSMHQYLMQCTEVTSALSYCCCDTVTLLAAAAAAAAAGSKLYILNANFKCDKEAGCAPEEGGTIALLRQVAASFDAGSSQ